MLVMALGYKYDFVLDRLVKTGSFQIRTNVSSAVYLNDKLAGNTSFLGNTFSKTRLLPRVYEVRVHKENFQSWQKDVSISAGLLTDFPLVVLLPEDFTEKVIATTSFRSVKEIKFDKNEKTIELIDGATNVKINLGNGKIIEPSPLKKNSAESEPDSPDEKILTNVLKSPDKTKKLEFTKYEIWVEWLEPSNYQPFHQTGDRELITRFAQPIYDVQWYKDSGHLLANVGGIIKFLEIDTRGGTNSYDTTSTDWPFWYSSDKDAIYKFEKGKITRISLRE